MFLDLQLSLNSYIKWSREKNWLSRLVLASESAKQCLPNSYFWYIFGISLQDSNAKFSHSILNMRPHYNSQFYPATFIFLVLKPLDVYKHVQIVCQHYDLYFSISLIKFLVVSCLEINIFDTMESCVTLDFSTTAKYVTSCGIKNSKFL